MKSLFFIEIPNHFPLTEDYTYYWYKKELNNESAGQNTLAEIKANSLECDLIAIFPGFSILQSQMQSTIKNRKKLELAIAYHLEEQLSEEIDQLFFAYQPSKEKAILDVVVINRVWLEKWLELFKQHQIQLIAATTDLLLLQTISHENLLIKKVDYYLLKNGLVSYAVDNSNIDYFLTKLKASLPENLEFIDSIDVPTSIAAHSLIETKFKKTDDLLKILTENYNLNNDFNLLQGVYKPKLRDDWQIIKYSTIALFSLLLMATAFQGYRQWKLSQQELQLEQKRDAIFHASFPAIKRIVNPLAQMKNELETLKQSQLQQGQLITLLAKVAVASREMIAQQRVQLLAIEFSENVLTLKFNANSLEITEQIKQLLQQQQLTVEIESSDKAGNQVTATFKISGNPA